jgi:outer membrane protein assembly factor BamB
VVLKSSPVVLGTTVYIGSLDGNLYAIDANSGSILWKTPTNGPIDSSPAVANGSVFFTSQEPSTGVLYRVDATNGNVIWKQDLPYETQFTGGNEMLASPSVAAGMVFAVANIRTYYGINETTGAYVWNLTDPSATEFVVLSPIYNNGQLYIIDKYDITSVNAMTGRRNWAFFTGDELYISPSYADGKIYVVTSQKDIFILDANNSGAKLATYKTPSSCWSSPTIANGNLYVGCNDWNLYCFSNSPAQLTTISSPTPKPTTSPISGGYLSIVLAVIIALVIIILAAAAYTLRKRSKT